MKLVAEYLADAIKFDQMAEDATDAALKGSFRKQAAEYWKLALKRAKQCARLGVLSYSAVDEVTPLDEVDGGKLLGCLGFA
jgi:hypothetical protein